ncbi:MAG TPA: hypothetical protein VM677_11720 [Actinokineospora sp.]|nr:hypothetical protein [Actinokineospora sp.]
MNTSEETDLAANLVALADKLVVLAARCRQHAQGVILEWATTENADRLVDVLGTTAVHVRACRSAGVVSASDSTVS